MELKQDKRYSKKKIGKPGKIFEKTSGNPVNN